MRWKRTKLHDQHIQYVFQNESLSDPCFAPTGVWGAVCSSSVGFFGGDPAQLIAYRVEAVVESAAVFCKLLGQACYSTGVWCCFSLHPRTPSAGIPMWDAPYALIWGANAAVPQIQCYSTSIPTALTWSWSNAGSGGLGCYHGEKCEPEGC